jgi:aldehyde dehydrogenase (NAD+)
MKAHSFPSQPQLAGTLTEILSRLGVTSPIDSGDLVLRTPITGAEIGRVESHSASTISDIVGRAHEAFRQWRDVPAPVRGQLVRELGQLLREHKADLGTLVAVEAGKILPEGLGEVQEMIDMCDLAVGLSRQLSGRTIASERPGHRMMEQWHPLGVVGIISAFNFPVAVWSWNAAVALVCGDPVVWKPSEKSILTAMACQSLIGQAAQRAGAAGDVSSLVFGGAEAGMALVQDPRVALVSATGSTRMGRAVAPQVAGRFGRLLLELGGNNAAIVTPSADLDLALRGIVFSAAGTSGQRCTTLRRVIAHVSVIDDLTSRIKAAFETLPIGSPLDPGSLVGPLIDRSAFEAYQAAIEKALAEGGKLITGGARVLADEAPGAYYVQPTVIVMPEQSEIVRTETFAPILYMLPYSEFVSGAGSALELHNDVPQGLSSSIFTMNVREAERFLSADGSDCGIANVNIGPSGAEIGGAFGGEKETGGGREAGSDAWKSYMRRVTNTVNYSTELPLAQGVKFG